jgi:protein TonB
MAMLSFAQTVEHPLSIGEGITPPVLTRQVDPKFSHGMRKHVGRSNVVVHVVIDNQGVPVNLSLVSPGDPDFDQSALKAVSQWRFKPAMTGGEPVAVELKIDVQFSIEPR